MVNRVILGITLVSLCFLGLRGILPILPAYTVPTIYLMTIVCICIYSSVFISKQEKIGELANAIGLLTDHDIQLVLGIQKSGDSKFGEVAIKEQLLTEKEVTLLLQIQAT